MTLSPFSDLHFSKVDTGDVNPFMIIEMEQTEVITVKSPTVFTSMSSTTDSDQSPFYSPIPFSEKLFNTYGCHPNYV